MIVIGITGPTGAGKTTALQQLQEMGGVIIDCDAVYHDLLRDSKALQRELTVRFGDILDGQGSVDRKRLGGVVFRDPDALQALNDIVRVHISKAVDAILADAKEQGVKLAAVDGITIIESGLARRCDATVAVLAPEDDRVRRICRREGISEEYARARVAAQKEDGFFRANCDYVLVNDCAGREEFALRARSLFDKLMTQLQGGKGHE